MKVLVLNAGSSSLKYQLIDTASEEVTAKGLCERVGSRDSFHKYSCGEGERTDTISLENHHAAVQAALDAMCDPITGSIGSLEEVDAVGHRVVHGGEFFTQSAVITSEVLERIEECSALAPLHNPAALMGINACLDLLPGKTQVAVFDTAFHQSMPPHAYMYPLPYEYYEEHRIRRYGFHGTSHRYLTGRAAAMLQRGVGELRLITCHLGNGCSVTAVSHGDSVETSMGFTPLEGLMMGTRSGSIDPAIVTYLIEQMGMTAAEANAVMNKKSGLLGVSGISNDLRDVLAAADGGDGRAKLASELYSASVKKQIGAYVFAMGGVDAIVLAGGVGENSDKMRAMILGGLEEQGIVLSPEANLERNGERVISSADSRVAVLVIPTNEELMIAKDVSTLVAE
jgi:acetate kinase